MVSAVKIELIFIQSIIYSRTSNILFDVNYQKLTIPKSTNPLCL